MGWKGALVEGPLAIASRFVASWGPLPSQPEEILVLRSNDLGDVLTTTPMFEALRGRFPKSRIIAAVGSWAAPVLANNPHVDEIVTMDAPWNNKFVPDQSWRAVRRFLFSSEQVDSLRRRGGFDVGIDVLGSHVGSILLMHLGARYRIGVRGYRGGWSACQQYIRFSDRVHVGRAALHQAELPGVTRIPEVRPQLFPTAAEREEAERLWAMRGTGGVRLLVGCGGGLPEKCWPVEQLARALTLIVAAARANESMLDVLIVGSDADRERGRRIAEEAGASVRSVCGETSLRLTFALCERATAVLANASMLSHAAAAFRRPSTVVLGGMNPDAASYDALWGYPPPYRSVAPASGTGWPDADQVAASIISQLASFRERPAGR